ncbi:MAG: hypothetical protein ACE5DX_03550 [Candidatus Dojkabacteria bacterium]
MALTKRKKQKDLRQSIVLKENLYNAAREKANVLGLSITDYFRYLIVRDTEDLLNIPYLSDEAEKSLAEAYNDIKHDRIGSIKSIKEFMDSL